MSTMKYVVSLSGMCDPDGTPLMGQDGRDYAVMDAKVLYEWLDAQLYLDEGADKQMDEGPAWSVVDALLNGDSDAACTMMMHAKLIAFQNMMFNKFPALCDPDGMPIGRLMSQEEVEMWYKGASPFHGEAHKSNRNP